GDFGLIGLAVMGQNLILNMADHGFTVVAFNRTVSKVDRFLENEAKGKSIVGAHSIKEFTSKLKTPRRMMLLVQAGKAVDQFIETLLTEGGLEKGDIIIDGGNSHYPDSNRRCRYLAEKGIRFVGSGVSGGEEGARYGPSIMPGGNEEAWPYVKDVLQAISAKSDGEPCCQWVGDEGAGHYVKMVHNGIEYGDMQLISEAYDIMKRGLGLSNKEMGDIFATWNKGVLDSFLIEITRDIMYYNDDDGTPLLEKIMDSAGQKGTGKWTAINALDLGMPVTLIGEAVFARCLSSLKDERIRASSILSGPEPKFSGDKQEFIDNLEQALYASKIISYAQGFMLIQNAAKEYSWKLNKPEIALMWRGGCIIRSVFLKDITTAYRSNPDLENLLFDDFFNKAIHKAQPGWRDIVSKGALWGIPLPAFSTALSFFDGYRQDQEPTCELAPGKIMWLPFVKCAVNLQKTQAQRDYFGAHTFRMKPEAASESKPEKTDIHVNWTGRGGNAGGGGRVATPKPGPQSGVDVEALSKSVGARIKVTTSVPGAMVEGTLFTLCKTTNLLAIKDVNSPPAPPTPSSNAPAIYHLVSLANVTGFEIVQAAGEGEKEQASPTLTKAENDALNLREVQSIREAKKWEYTRGKGVSREAQEIHDHIMRTLPTRWNNQQIIINDAVVLEPPYRVENCKAPEKKSAALQQIKKVVEGYWSKKQPQTKGGQNNRGPAPVIPLNPKKGG
ncbi:phosphogluconate dehydrogenase (decarboxylating) gnd1, partial [Venturia inaequalis]